MVHDSPATLTPRFLQTCQSRPLPKRLLMCPPAHFDVIDVKNPHMEGQVGRVDRTAADEQWHALRAAFERCGVEVSEIAPTPGCEDMVFCANQTLVGIGRGGERICLLSNMRYASRQREVPAFEKWFAAEGYRVTPGPAGVGLEGSGDAIWHPGRGLIWGGHGYRTEPAAYPHVAETFGVPVLRLKLLSNKFYHLDTCFCAVDERTVLIDPRCFEPRGLELIRAVFERVVEVPPDEAEHGMACNATALLGRHVVIQRGNPRTVAALRGLGFEVHEVETGEFLKSGGSVFCMKMYVF